MRPENKIRQKIIQESAHAATGTSRLTTMRPKTDVLNRIQDIRDRATHEPDADSVNPYLELMHEVEGALSVLQTSINAATAEVNYAKTPDQRRRAELRLIRLMAQKKRLEMQLGQAKIAQLNAVGKSKLL